ncbi:hypothetical protein P692DRAFT_20900667 [Suillus brevipes Sb2]|nr:hypothetical protein P692DRAFT_20900667 [Suillus brevipes Sb2]
MDSSCSSCSNRSVWLPRAHGVAAQIQILLYFITLPGPCTPLLPVEVPRPSGVNATYYARYCIFSSPSPPAAFRNMRCTSVPANSFL